jgi:hypothetical protein
MIAMTLRTAVVVRIVLFVRMLRASIDAVADRALIWALYRAPRAMDRPPPSPARIGAIGGGVLLVVAGVAALLLSGCAFAVDVAREPNAPTLPPASSAEVVHVEPKGATKIATIELQGNNWQSASDCEARLVIEARKVGANVMFTQPEESGLGQGPKCRGAAYAVPR